MNQLPHLKTLYNNYLTEDQPFRKVHRMIDLFESIIKTHTVLILAGYVKHNKLSDKAKGLLSQGLRTPSLGTWQLFSRVLFEELVNDNYIWISNSFADEFRALDKALQSEKTNVIAFRNGYAHGATPTDAQCETDIQKFNPFLMHLMQYKWLEESSLEVQEGETWIISAKGSLSLHPILLYRKEDSEASYAFFNDLKNEKIGLLNYTLNKHYKEKELFTEFHKHLPLHDWKKSGNNEFYQRIEELTETFKGRTFERNKIAQFVLKNSKGYFSIQGNPGIGKSALIAQFIKDLRVHPELKNIKVIEYFIRRGTQQAQVEYLLNYLIRCTDEVFEAGRDIRTEGKMVFDLQNQLFSKWHLWGEQNKGQQLLFLIDGLDEGVENNLVAYLPRENFKNILFIYGSRPGGHKSIDDLWAQLPVLNHTKLELAGLGIGDIRGLIYEVANKYEIDRESAWIDAVQLRSQGNPLYLKLLCDAIENGSMSINDINALPKEINEYYKAILLRYAQDSVDGDALLAGLFTFAAAKDYLTFAHLELINHLGPATLQRIRSTLKEVLYENPSTENVLDYQLFHESFREYLVRENQKQVIDATGRIIDFCINWKDLSGTWEQRYAFEHLALHLSESKKAHHHELLLELIYNKAYVTEQKKILKSFDSSTQLYQLGLLKASELDKFDNTLEAALCLVDINYEESNDAPQIIELVANGDIDMALKRIERFGGSDREGMERKFVLYMLCLMELILLGSKGKQFKKIGVEKLLNHLEEHIPPDTSLIDWDDIFSSYLIFLMACECDEFRLKAEMLSWRTYSFDFYWILEKGPYTIEEFKVLVNLGHIFKKKYTDLMFISNEMSKQGMIQEASELIQKASEFIDVDGREEVLRSHSKKLLSDNLIKKGEFKEAIECGKRKIHVYYGDWVLENISIELSKLGRFDESLECIESMDHKESSLRKDLAKKNMAIEMSKVGKIDKAIECTYLIDSVFIRIQALTNISTEIKLSDEKFDITHLMQEALILTKSMRSEMEGQALYLISLELDKQGNHKEANKVLGEVFEHANWLYKQSEPYYAKRMFCYISDNLAKVGCYEKVVVVMKLSLEKKRGLYINWRKVYFDLLSDLAQKGKIKEAVEYSSIHTYRSGIEFWDYSNEVVTYEDEKSYLAEISMELAAQGKYVDALEVAEKIEGKLKKNNTFGDISKEYAKQGKYVEARKTAQKIEFNIIKDLTLKEVSIELAKQGKVYDAISFANEITEAGSNFKCIAQINIYSALIKNNKNEAELLLNELLDFTKKKFKEDDGDLLCSIREISLDLAENGMITEALICSKIYKETDNLIKDISSKLAKRGKFDEALLCVSEINDVYSKFLVLNSISTEMAIIGKLDESDKIFKESLDIAYGIIDYKVYSKCIALNSISTEEMTINGKFDDFDIILNESRGMAHGTIDYKQQSQVLKNIFFGLAKKNKVESIFFLLEEALVCARKIHDDDEKREVLNELYTELAILGFNEEVIEYSRKIDTLDKKNDFLEDLSSTMAYRGNWAFAEKTGLEISQIGHRHRCWKSMGSMTIKNGWESALTHIQAFHNHELPIFYLQGLIEELSPKETDITCFKKIIPLIVKDTKNIENLLQCLALHELMFGKPTKEMIQRFKKTLDLRWAIDIIDKFPKEIEEGRFSNNLESWIHEIADEDDRDQIELWAMKVAKSKMTEDEFNKRVKNME
jgi:hypothetical protein